jgi:hypothetical protein
MAKAVLITVNFVTIIYYTKTKEKRMNLFYFFIYIFRITITNYVQGDSVYIEEKIIIEIFFHLRKCVTYCPIGYYANEPKNKCIKCDNDCLECNGPTKSNCTSCKNKLFLKLDTNECVSNCPLETGYFLSK